MIYIRLFFVAKLQRQFYQQKHRFVPGMHSEFGACVMRHILSYFQSRVLFLALRATLVAWFFHILDKSEVWWIYNQTFVVKYPYSIEHNRDFCVSVVRNEIPNKETDLKIRVLLVEYLSWNNSDERVSGIRVFWQTFFDIRREFIFENYRIFKLINLCR